MNLQRFQHAEHISFAGGSVIAITIASSEPSLSERIMDYVGEEIGLACGAFAQLLFLQALKPKLCMSDLHHSQSTIATDKPKWNKIDLRN